MTVLSIDFNTFQVSALWIEPVRHKFYIFHVQVVYLCASGNFINR